jgi:oligosaccharide repeat unit polymerase
MVIAGAITLASLFLTLSRAARPLSLVLAREAGFFVLIVLEGTMAASSIIADVGGSAYGTATRYLVAANAAVVIAHVVVFRAARFDAPSRWQYSFSPGHTAAFLVGVSAAYYVVCLPWVLAVMQNGRNIGFAFGPTALAPFVEGFVAAAGLSLPSLYVFAFTRVLGRPLRSAVLLSLPVFAVHFIVGTRFPLLFAVAGIFVARFGDEPVRVATWVRGIVVVVLVVLAMGLMVQFRTRGISNVAPSEVVSGLVGKGVDTSEEIVLTEARLVDYYTRSPHLGGRSTTSVFVVWIPRALWSAKPTLLEYWFPREYGLRGIPDNHSIGAGFPADGYADFGFMGGVAVSLLIGLGLGAADRGCSRVLAEGSSPYLVLVGPLFGATFFAVRSLNTAVIAATGVLVLAWLFSKAVSTRRVPVSARSQDAPAESSMVSASRP